MTRFLPAQIFSVSVPAYGSRTTRLSLRVNPFSLQTDILRVEKDRTGCERVVRDSRQGFGAEGETRVRPCRAVRDGPMRGPTL